MYTVVYQNTAYRSFTNTHSLWSMSQHALQELEQLTVETAKMEKERRTLEFILRDSRAGKDSIRYKSKLLLTVLYTVYTNMVTSHCINTILFCIKGSNTTMNVL